MVLDSGNLTVWRGANLAPSGGMPDFSYKLFWVTRYAEKTVGVSRFYSAKQYGERPDYLVRVPRNYDVKVGSDIVTLSPFSHKDENEYRILQIQHIVDEDGLPVMEMTLQLAEVNDEEFK